MIFVRPDEVITPAGMPKAQSRSYVLDVAATRHGLHVAGTAAEWAAEVAAPLRGNSNVALSFATFFAAPLLRWASEPGGGHHLYGRSTIGKTMISDVGQSIYGWPHETSDDAFGVSWGGTAAWRRYCNGVDPAEIARHFQERGALIADDNGVSKAEQVIGKVERFYVLSRAALTP
jgi:uncharacterized protein (DUF927 family)